MTVETSRRNFLKGLMAAAGIVAVSFPVSIADAAPVQKAVAPLPDMEMGDVWVIVGDGNQHFVGRAETISMTRDTIDMTKLGDLHPVYAPGAAAYVDVVVHADTPGAEIIDTLAGNNKTIFLFGMKSGHIRVPAVVRNSTREDRPTGMTRFGLQADVNGPMTVVVKS